MRRFVACLLLLLLVCLPALAAPNGHVVDQHGLFTTEQHANIEQRAKEIWNKYRFDVLFVTTDDSQGKSARLFAADFFESYRPDFLSYPDGATFSFNFDLGEYFNATRGLGERILPTGSDEALDNLLQPYFSPKKYYAGTLAYLDFVEQRLEKHMVVGQDGIARLSAEARKPGIMEAAGMVFDRYLLFLALAGLAIGIGIAFFLKSRLLIAKHQSGAAEYAQRNSLTLRDSSDIYLYQTVVRTKIPEKSSSSGGGRSGGGFSSSSGRSYGGTGGKL